MVLATGQITLLDLTDLPSLQGYLVSNQPTIQFLNTGGTYSPSWATSPNLVVSAELYTVGSGANIIENTKVESITWKVNGTVIAAGNTDYVLVAGTGGKYTSLKISKNLLTALLPTIQIEAIVNYKQSSSFAATPVKMEITFGLVQQGAQGPSGETAKLLNLSTDTNVFTYDAYGAASPATQTATFTPVLVNLSGGTLTWAAVPYDAAGAAMTAITASLTGTGNSKTLSIAKFPAGAVRVVVTASYTGGYSDTVTIVKLSETATYTSYLTNESATLAASPSGTVDNWAPASGDFVIYRGTELMDPTLFTYGKTDVGITSTISATGHYAVTAMASDSGTSTYTATLKTNSSIVLKKVFSVSKSKAGANGNDTYLAYVWAPNGSIFKTIGGVTPGGLVAQCDFYKAGNLITTGATYQWFVQDGSADAGTGAGAGWGTITGQTAKTLAVTPAMVTTMENFKCVVTYGGIKYAGMVGFEDKTDPYQVEIVVPQGTTFVNGEGADKHLKAKVYQNGVQVDTNGTIFTYTWKKYVGGVAQAGTLTGQEIIVYAADIETEATYICEIS